MPRLYSIPNDFDPKSSRYNPSHFFPSAYWGRHWGSSEAYWKYDLDEDFPAQCHIHIDAMPDDSDNRFWIALRKDVERRYQGDCFFDYHRLNYRRWYNTGATSEYMREYDTQQHGYWTFYFEEGSDQMMFVLKNAEILSPKRYRFHPVMGVSCEDHRYDVPDDEKIEGAWKV